MSLPALIPKRPPAATVLYLGYRTRFSGSPSGAQLQFPVTAITKHRLRLYSQKSKVIVVMAGA